MDNRKLKRLAVILGVVIVALVIVLVVLLFTKNKAKPETSSTSWYGISGEERPADAEMGPVPVFPMQA